MVFSVIVLLAWVLELVVNVADVRATFHRFIQRLRTLVPQRSAPFLLSAVVVVFFVQLAIVTRAAHSLEPSKPWIEGLPIPIVWVYPVDLVSQFVKLAFVSVSVIESLLLATYLVSVWDRPWRRADTIATAICATAIGILALAAPTMTSADMYAYVGDALVGARRAYTPPPAQLPGEFAIIHRMWHGPLLPAAYGPVWLWWNGFVLGFVPTLHAKLIALRLLNVGALGAILVALRRLGAAQGIVAAAAVNPAIAFYYITNGHNDLVVVAIILVAMTIAQHSPIAAGIIAGIGASIKVTLVVPAAAAAVVITALPRRLLFVVVLVVTAAAIALFLGGRPYFHALAVISDHYSGANRYARVRIPHIAVALLTIVLTTLAIMKRRTFKAIVFGFASLAQAFYPWYAIWGLPYAAARNDLLATLLIGLPVIAAVLEVEIRSSIIGPLIIVMLAFAIGVVLVRRRRASLVRVELN